MRDAVAALALHTELRRAVDRLSEGRTGGLFVLGFDERVDELCQDGFPLDVPASADNLCELGGRELAVVLSTDLRRILRFNVDLEPVSRISAQGKGKRHRTAMSMARDIEHPVVTVSEDTGTATVFLGDRQHQLVARAELFSRSTAALLTLDACVTELPEGTWPAGALAERARRAITELEGYLVELGSEGERVHDQLAHYRERLGIDDAHQAPMRVPAIHAVVRELDEWHEHGLAAADRALTERPPAAQDRAFPRLSFDSELDAVRWCDRMLGPLRQAITHAAETGAHAVALRRTLALLEYCYRRKPWEHWIGLADLAVRSARELDDRAAEASLLTSLGVAHRELGRLDTALQRLTTARQSWHELGDPAGEAGARNHLAYAQLEDGAGEQALGNAEAALELARQAGDTRLEGTVLNNLSVIHRRAGRLEHAQDCAGSAIDVFQRAGYRRESAWATTNQGNVHRDAGRHAEAIACYRAALDARLDSGDDYGAAITRADLAAALAAEGERTRAAEHWRDAWHYFTELGDPRAEPIRRALDQAVPR